MSNRVLKRPMFRRGGMANQGIMTGLVDRSGYEILDVAALKAVKEAAPFYPFPETIRQEKLSIQANFIYTPNFESVGR